MEKYYIEHWIYPNEFSYDSKGVILRLGPYDPSPVTEVDRQLQPIIEKFRNNLSQIRRELCELPPAFWMKR